MPSYQAIVWIDEHLANILRMNDGLKHQSTVCAQERSSSGEEPVPASAEGANCPPSSYFHRVARALDMADEILIVGPSSTKAEFLSYMNRNEHALDPRILGVETISHPTDLELAAFAELYFAVGGPQRSRSDSGPKPID